MSIVRFASCKVKAMSAEATLPAKFRRMLAEYTLGDMFGGKKTAVKMHLGGRIGYTTIRPLFVRTLVEAIKEAGGEPFITDVPGSVNSAVRRGYTSETVSAPIVPVAGPNDEYYRTVPIGYKSLKEVYLAGNVLDADAMIVFSHGKGHGHCGYGGAIKNLAMGAVTGRTRGLIHRLIDTEFDWNEGDCVQCYLCRENCPTGAVSFNEKDEFTISMHDCKYCMHCVNTCPVHAIEINLESMRQFQEGMARTTKAILDTFEPSRVLFITYLLDITPFCDCWGFSTPPIVPDIGIVASDDMVAQEQAAIDAIKAENFIEGTLPPPLSVGSGPGHLLERIHGKDPYLQVEVAADLGLGKREYNLVEID